MSAPAMTPFESWQAGLGPEPVEVAELPCEPSFLPPRGWRYLGTWYSSPVAWYRSHEADEREELALGEECRAALELAIRFLPSPGDWIPATKGEDPWAR